METFTRDQIKQKYGTLFLSEFPDKEKEESLFESLKSQIGEAAKGGLSQMAEGIEEGQTNTNPLQQVESGAKIAAGAVNTAFSPLAPISNAINKYVVKPASDFISGSKNVQEFADSDAGEVTSRVAEDVGNLSTIAGGVLGPKVGAGVAKSAAKVPGQVDGVMPKLPPGAGKYVAGAVRDVVPTKQALIDTNLAKALDLTPGDLRNIKASTGNDIGPWLSSNNLIGINKSNTQGLISGFFKKNYEEVRAEIAKVKDLYSADAVPRYRETLNALAVETQGKLGLEAASKEIQTLLKKEQVTLADVQRVKELLDDHYSLYNRLGDVQQAAQKQGLANVRDEIKTFIESEVKQKTGADIRQMNNNVSTAKSLNDAIEARTPRGLTRANITWRDAMVGLGVYAFASPLVGLAAVVAYKLATSPTARLRFARWLDQRTDAQKAKINEAFKRGEVPDDVKEVMGLEKTSQASTP